MSFVIAAFWVLVGYAIAIFTWDWVKLKIQGPTGAISSLREKISAIEAKAKAKLGG